MKSGRDIVFSALIGLLILFVGSASGATSNALPWYCGFEEDEFGAPFFSDGYTNGMPLINGTNGWYADSSDVFVQTNVISTNASLVFTNNAMAAAIGDFAILSNRFDSSSTPAITGLWMQMDVRVSIADENAEEPDVDSDATSMFYISSNGYFCVQHITNWAVPSTNWVTISNTVTGAEFVPYDTNSWVRLNLYQNYTNKTWALFVDYNLITNNINFVNTNINTFSGFDIQNRSFTTSFLDNISFSFDRPLDLAADGGDWLPDMNVNTNALDVSVFAGLIAAPTNFMVWKTTNYFDLVFSNSVSTNWLQVDTVVATNNGVSSNVVNVTFAGSDSLAVGNYNATIVVSGWDSEFGFPVLGASTTIDVSLAVGYVPSDMEVSPTAISDEISKGHKAPGASFIVWNNSAEPRDVMNYSISKDVAWITLSSTNGMCVDNTNTVWLTYDTSTLASGWHTGVVTLVSTGSGAKTNEVVVSMRVNETPSLAVNASGWTNVISIGDSWSSTNFFVWNNSGLPRGKLRYDISDDMEWLTLSSSGGVSTGEQHGVMVNFDTEDLPQGVYTGSVFIVATDEATGDSAVGSPLALGVSLTVQGNVQLATGLRAFTNTVLEGYTVTNNFGIWNSGGEPWGNMGYAVSKDVSWISSVSPSSGTVTSNTNDISVVFNSGTLSPGTYTGKITVDATNLDTALKAHGAPQSKSVALIVKSRTPLNFELPEILGGVPQIGRTLEVDNGLWQYANRLDFSYQWQRASSVYGHNLVNIPGAISSNYVVTAEDKGAWLRVRVTAVDSYPSPLSTTVYSEFKSSSRIKVVPGDFSGDGKTDLWFFDPLPGIWRISFYQGGSAELQFGSWEMTAVPGDYNGSGAMDFGLYHQESGMWYVLLMPSMEFASLQFGASDMVPVSGDFDGDGKTDIALYHEASGYWYFLLSNSGYSLVTLPFGAPGYQPVVSDYDGDGKDDIAIYHEESGKWYIKMSGNNYIMETIEFGGPGAIAAPGDYDGDGISDLAVYWSTSNLWEILESSTGRVRREMFGTSNGAGVPAPGYFDSDNMLDPATVHINHINGPFVVWCINRSADGYRGQSYQININMWRVAW